jgi:hypothetical protein
MPLRTIYYYLGKQKTKTKTERSIYFPFHLKVRYTKGLGSNPELAITVVAGSLNI